MMSGPGGMPKAVADKLKSALQTVFSDPDVKKQLQGIGYTVVYRDGDTFGKFVLEQEAVFRKVAKEASIRLP